LGLRIVRFFGGMGSSLITGAGVTTGATGVAVGAGATTTSGGGGGAAIGSGARCDSAIPAAPAASSDAPIHGHRLGRAGGAAVTDTLIEGALAIAFDSWARSSPKSPVTCSATSALPSSSASAR